MPPHKGARRGGRGGRGAGRTKSEEQPAAQAANPTTSVTQVDFTTMEHTYQDMQRDALVPFHAAQQTQPAPAQTFVEPQNVPDHLSVEAKHLRDCRKYNLKTFDGLTYAKQQEFLNLKQGDMIVEQYDTEFDMSTTHADALHLAVDMGLHERVNPSKAARRGSTPGRKRKAELQPTIAP
ncbi:gag-protease polyprotein [Cucumis melo var. makuwa]|uniref:Gag-protease polyprotein n=1 Tax=Cucumis melo var. makuwa TaxID=1194695 RepID=A0A5D3DDK7_CUCMM|nr:gag-protease polyprotein [Cucumis melo var. makuwa]